MHPYALIPLAACITSATIAVSLWLRAPANRRLLPVVWLGILGAFWALCELLWSLAPSPEAALPFQRLSALGWVGLGPLALHVVHQAIGQPDRRMVRIIGALYALAGLFLALTWATPWMVERAVPTAWGYTAAPGTVFPIWPNARCIDVPRLSTPRSGQAGRASGLSPRTSTRLWARYPGLMDSIWPPVSRAMESHWHRSRRNSWLGR